MIHVKGRLTSGSTYIAGEDIECQLIFTNKSREQNAIRLSSDVVTLAWATAQIHCQCTVSEGVALPRKEKSVITDSSAVTNAEQSPGQTAFHPTKGHNGLTVIRSEPRILFCNIRISPGESVQYTYKEELPYHCYPSFKGSFVKYSYQLTVGTQRPDDSISEIRIPFRVISVEGLKEATAYQHTQQELAPSNPFHVPRKDNSQPELTIKDLALQLIADQSARKRQKCFNISNKRGKVASVTLSKTSFKLGEDIWCTFDFSENAVQCLQVTVTLRSIEEITAKHRRSGQKCINVISHAVHKEFCLHMSKANVSLPVPLHVTQSFSSELVSLRWQLQMEFVSLVTPISEQETPDNDKCAVLWQGITDLDTETMHWDLPIKLLATNPLQCSLLHTSIKHEGSVTLNCQ